MKSVRLFVDSEGVEYI